MDALDQLKSERRTDRLRSMSVVEKAYDSKQPRWPEGMPGIGGEWKPAGAPQAVLAGVQDVFTGIKSSEHPTAPAIALLVRRVLHDIQWDDPGNKLVSSRLYQIGRVYGEGKSAAAVNGDKTLYERFEAKLTQVKEVQSRTNIAGEGGVKASSPFQSTADRELGPLTAENPNKGIPRKVIGLSSSSKPKPKQPPISEVLARARKTQAIADQAFRDYMKGKRPTSHFATRKKNEAETAYMELYTHPDYNPDVHKMEDHEPFTAAKPEEVGQTGEEVLVPAEDVKVGDVIAGRFGAKDREVTHVRRHPVTGTVILNYGPKGAKAGLQPKADAMVRIRPRAKKKQEPADSTTEDVQVQSRTGQIWKKGGDTFRIERVEGDSIILTREGTRMQRRVSQQDFEKEYTKVEASVPPVAAAPAGQLIHPRTGMPFTPKHGWTRREDGTVEVLTGARKGRPSGPTVPIGRVWRERGGWRNDRSDKLFTRQQDAGADLYNQMTKPLIGGGAGARAKKKQEPADSTKELAAAVIHDLEADKLKFGEDTGLTHHPDPFPKDLPLTGDISIMTEASNPLYRLKASAVDRKDFYLARNKLASGRFFSDLTSKEANALEAVVDQNALDLSPDSEQGKLLLRVGRELRLARGETPGPRPAKVPKINFDEAKGVPLVAMTRGELYRLALSYGISVKNKTKAQIVRAIEEKRDVRP